MIYLLKIQEKSKNNQLIAFPLHSEKNPSFLTQRIKQFPIPEYFYTF